MIYDCFPFNDELDLLEMRLNILDPIVDKFVIVEATKTHTGIPKDLFFLKNKNRFSAFSHKIIHVIVKTYPEIESPWTIENYQRNQILCGLQHAHADDIILLSDLDEIPNPAKVIEYSQRPGRYIFLQDTYMYYLNCRRYLVNTWHYGLSLHWEGTQMMPYHEFLHCYDSIECPNCSFLRPAVNKGTSPSKIRFLRSISFKYINEGGWHFTSLGGIKTLRNKLKAYAHQEKSYLLTMPEADMLKELADGIDPLSGRSVYFVPIGKNYPMFIVENQNRYRSLFMPNQHMSVHNPSQHLMRRVIALYIDKRNKIMYYAIAGSHIVLDWIRRKREMHSC